MTAEEERLLIVRAKGGDIAARNELVTTWMDLVYKTARKHMFSAMTVDDMAQEGVFGLIHAINKFDLKKNFRFSTYARAWIINFMYRAKINRYTLVRKPLHLYIKRGDREAVSIESPQSIDATHELSHGPTSPLLMGIAEHRNFISEADDADEAEVQLEDIPGAIAMLTDIEAKVIKFRYGLDSGKPGTTKAASHAMHMATRTINNIEKRAIAKLRKAIRA